MLRLEVRGVRETRERLEALVSELGDMSDLWDRFAGVMVATEEEWFATGGEGTWPRLAASTERDRFRQGYLLLGPLIRTGALLESLTNPEQAMQIGQGRSTLGTFTRNAMTWGTDVQDERGREYAHYHQGTDPVTGEPAGYAPHPPERQVIPWPLPVHTQAALLSEEEAWLAEIVRKAGL